MACDGEEKVKKNDICAYKMNILVESGALELTWWSAMVCLSIKQVCDDVRIVLEPNVVMI